MKKSILMLIIPCLFITMKASENSKSIDLVLESELTKSISKIEESLIDESVEYPTVFAEKNQDSVEDIINYFSNLLPKNNEKLTPKEWDELTDSVKLVFQENGEIDQDVQKAIDLIQGQAIHAQNPQLEGALKKEALSCTNTIKKFARETRNKLHQKYNSGKIDKKHFKELFKILNDFLNRLPSVTQLSFLKEEVLFLEQEQDSMEDITNYFSNLIPKDNENNDFGCWKLLIEEAIPVLQKDGDMNKETSDVIRYMKEKNRQYELISFKNTISRSARTATYKLHRLYNSGKIDKAQFKILYGMIRDFINRLSK